MKQVRPIKLKTKIFLDGGDPDETKQVISLLGFLDGQTTNPTLISKNPDVATRLEKSEKFTADEIFEFYRKVVQEISLLIPYGSVSIEVPADNSTSSDQLLSLGSEMFTWIPNAHIKYPTTKEGLIAAEISVKKGVRVNMTLCFSQEQAAAVYTATIGATKDQVFVSPFIGRLDDRGENGMDLIKNIIEMYKRGDNHVRVLTASVRSLDHLLYAIKLGSDIITAPFEILKEWAEKSLPLPDEHFVYNIPSLKSIPYQQIDLNKPWHEYNIFHELTDRGIEKFSIDWNSLSFG